MSSRPPLLPEEKNKRSTQPAKRIPAGDKPAPVARDLVGKLRRRTGLLIISIILILLISLVWIVTVTLIAYRPDLIGYDQAGDIAATAAAFDQTAIALDDAGLRLDNRAGNLNATVQAVAAGGIANAETQAALQNFEAVLNRSATQAVVDNMATQTAVGAENALQATQGAVAFAGTQAAFDQQATQAALEFQGTQAALNRDATAVALGFATAPPDTLPTFTPPPTPLFSEGFTTGIDSGRWNLSADADWQTASDSAVIARRSGAWLLTKRDDLTDYGFVVAFSPLMGARQAAFYYVPLNVTVGNSGGVAIEIFHDGAQVTQVGLFSVTASAFDGPFWAANLPPIETAAVTVFPEDGLLTVQIEVRGGRVTVYLQERAMLDVFLPDALPAGSVGVSMPAGTRVERLSLLP